MSVTAVSSGFHRLEELGTKKVPCLKSAGATDSHGLSSAERESFQEILAFHSNDKFRLYYIIRAFIGNRWQNAMNVVKC